MGFNLFGMSSESNASDSRIQASEYGRVARGNKNQMTEAGAVSVAEKGTFLAPQSAQVQGTKGNVSVTTSDPDVLKAALAFGRQSLSDYLAASGAQASSSNAAQSALLSSFLDQAGNIAATAQTGGASAAGSTFTKVLLGGLGIVALAIVAVLLWGKKGGLNLK